MTLNVIIPSRSPSFRPSVEFAGVDHGTTTIDASKISSSPNSKYNASENANTMSRRRFTRAHELTRYIGFNPLVEYGQAKLPPGPVKRSKIGTARTRN